MLPDLEPIDLHEDQNGEANVHLIAAAPDLYAGSDQDRIDLEALRNEITGGDCRWPPMALVLVDGILVSIERRLARARGEG